MSSVMYLSPLGDGARPDTSLLLTLGDAIQSRQCIDLSYRSEREETTRRVVEPYGLVGWRGKWYLVGWCRLRTDYRTFRLDRVRKLVPIADRFHRNEEFDFRTYAMKQLQDFPVNWTVRVLFAASLSRVRSRIGASLGTLTKAADGVELVWPVDDLDYAARYLLRKGMSFRVREPEELRPALRKVAQEAVNLAEGA
jgi:predicted DNA-binding transcriptional regulator YafY